MFDMTILMDDDLPFVKEIIVANQKRLYDELEEMRMECRSQSLSIEEICWQCEVRNGIITPGSAKWRSIRRREHIRRWFGCPY